MLVPWVQVVLQVGQVVEGVEVLGLLTNLLRDLCRSTVRPSAGVQLGVARLQA